jgi:hypothetical protein
MERNMLQGVITCKECRFFDDPTKVQGGYLRGKCKRYPAEIIDKKGNDWCGEAQGVGSLATDGFNRRLG